MCPSISSKHLVNYKEREEARGIDIADKLLAADFTIKNASALYPEYDLSQPYGIHRPGVNIALLMFFYRQVIAYVPPITINEFIPRFGIDYDTFLELAFPSDDRMKFIYPLLNHPRRYNNPLIRQELKEILLHMPPTWERWHSALNHTGGDIWFDKSDELFNYPNVWSLPQLRDYWKGRLRTDSESFVSREIKQQIRNNFTDLCLVGLESEANKIAFESNHNPELAINDLLFSSDYFAYPQVMGAGGTANIRIPDTPPIIIEQAQESIRNAIPIAEDFDSEVLRALFEGLKFNSVPDRIRLDFLLEWHKSNNAEKAREAYKILLDSAKKKAPDYESLHKTMKKIIGELEEFCKNIEPSDENLHKKRRVKNNIISGISALGGIVSTITGLFIHELLMALAGVGFTIYGLTSKKTRNHILIELLRKYAPNVDPKLFHAYRDIQIFYEDYIRKIEIKPNAVDPTSKLTSTSSPVKTAWWIEKS